MSISRRIATLFRVKANKALDRAEDPREVLDYSYEQQLEMVQKVRRGVADVATSRKRVELQLTQLQLSAGKLQGQAQQALGAGREDLARAALIRRAAVTSQISDLQGQQASLQAEEDKLALAAQRLEAKVGAFRTRKETIKAVLDDLILVADGTRFWSRRRRSSPACGCSWTTLASSSNRRPRSASRRSSKTVTASPAGTFEVTIVCGSNVDVDAYHRWVGAAPIHRS